MLHGAARKAVETAFALDHFNCVADRRRIDLSQQIE
jgi:hypothetical protein